MCVLVTFCVESEAVEYACLVSSSVVENIFVFRAFGNLSSMELCVLPVYFLQISVELLSVEDFLQNNINCYYCYTLLSLSLIVCVSVCFTEWRNRSWNWNDWRPNVNGFFWNESVNAWRLKEKNFVRNSVVAWPYSSNDCTSY